MNHLHAIQSGYVVVFLICVLVLVGYQAKIELLSNWGGPTMAIPTATCFVILSFCGWLSTLGKSKTKGD